MKKSEKTKFMNFVFDSIVNNFDNRTIDFNMNLLDNNELYFDFGNGQKFSFKLEKF